MRRLLAALQRLTPDPFSLAIGLTLVAFVAAFATLGSVDGALDAWMLGGETTPDGPRLGGFWSLLAFGMQMALVLMTGFVVASTAPVRRGLDRLAQLPGTPEHAVMLVALSAMLLALVHWGLGLIAGALLAREVGRVCAKRGLAVDGPTLAAAGYLGLAVWHGGLSGTAPLMATTEVDLLALAAGGADRLGEDMGSQGIPLTATILTGRNLVGTGLVVLLLPLVLARLHPDEARPLPGSAEAPLELPEESRVLAWLLALPMVLYLARFLADGGWNRLSPNELNLGFLALGLLLAGGPRRYMAQATRAASATAGILVQFPLYGGILGLVVASGLGNALVEALPLALHGMLPLATFLSAGLLNLFVPSGGGQWALQGPFVVEAAVRWGLDPGRVVLALAWGDQWTNLLQPFWALPLLGITGVRARDLLPITAVCAAVVGLVYGVAIALPG